MKISNKSIELLQSKYNLFKSQNPETGRFDVFFEIEGKLLYAHKIMITLESDTFDAMLSDRWTPNKDHRIKIETCSYDNFYQLITFLYSGECKLTSLNIYAMYDAAEFYGIQLFKDYCHEYLTKMEIIVENIFQLMDLAEKFSIIDLQTRINEFISNNFDRVIAFDGFLEIEKDVAKKLVIAHKYKIEPENLFRAVYGWCEKRGIDAQTENSNLNLNEMIKAEICDFLPHILFREMESKFLHEFVVSRGFIFLSWNEVSKILCDRDRFFEGKVKITNNRGQTLHGNLIPDKTVLRYIESIKQLTSSQIGVKYCYWNTKCKIPTTPSPLKKRNGVQWYLFYDYCGDITVSRCSELDEKNYLLAELTAGSTGFKATSNCKIEIE